MTKEKNKILIVEDEESIRSGLVDLFIFHGFEVDWASDGEEGLSKSLQNKYDLILLDIMLPKLNGYDVCNGIRNKNKSIPIIMLTAKDSEDDIINGLRLGADDYVTKPFSVRELVLRVQNILRRTSPLKVNLLKIGKMTLELENLKGVRSDGEEIFFTTREVELIQYLYSRKDIPASREELLEKVWGYKNTDNIETRTIDIHVAKLRKKLEEDSKNPRHLITIRGKGYRLEIE